MYADTRPTPIYNTRYRRTQAIPPLPRRLPDLSGSLALFPISVYDVYVLHALYDDCSNQSKDVKPHAVDHACMDHTTQIIVTQCYSPTPPTFRITTGLLQLLQHNQGRHSAYRVFWEPVPATDHALYQPDSLLLWKYTELRCAAGSRSFHVCRPYQQSICSSRWRRGGYINGD